MKNRFLTLGALFFFSVILTGCGLFQKSPEEAVRIGMERLAKTDRYQMELTLNGVGIAPEGELPARVDFDVKVGGYMDSEDAQEPVSDLAIDAALKMDQSTGDAEFDLRHVDKVLYLKINALDIPQLQGLFPPETMSQFLSKWWLVEQEENQSYFAQVAREQAAIARKLKEISVFKDIRMLEPEMIDGETMDRYGVRLDQEAFLEYLIAIGEANDNVISDSKRGAMRERLDELDFFGDIWVDESGIMRKLAGVLKSVQAEGGSFEINVEVLFTALGEEQIVAAPSGAQKFDSSLLFGGLRASFIPGGLGAAPGEAAETPIDDPLGAAQVVEPEEDLGAKQAE